MAYLTDSTEDILADVLAGIDLSGITSSVSLADQIDRLIPITKKWIDSVCGRDFSYHANDTIYCDGSGGDTLLLPFPILNTPVIYLIDENDIATELVSTYWRIDPQAGMVIINPGTSYTFELGFRNVEVTLDWGYQTPPDDVKYAQAHIIRTELLSRIDTAARSLVDGIQRQTVGVWTVTYAVSSAYRDVINESIAIVKQLVSTRGVSYFPWGDNYND